MCMGLLGPRHVYTPSTGTSGGENEQGEIYQWVNV